QLRGRREAGQEVESSPFKVSASADALRTRRSFGLIQSLALCAETRHVTHQTCVVCGHSIDSGSRDFRCKLCNVVEATGLLTSNFECARVHAVEKCRGDGSLNHV